jgi:hypothetical protein
MVLYRHVAFSESIYEWYDQFPGHLSRGVTEAELKYTIQKPRHKPSRWPAPSNEMTVANYEQSVKAQYGEELWSLVRRYYRKAMGRLPWARVRWQEAWVKDDDSAAPGAR